MTRGLCAWWFTFVPTLLLLVACRHESSTDGARADGEKIFGNVCARCHGADGKGGVAAGGMAAPRNFCDHAFQASRSDQDLKTVIKHGKGGMPAWKSVLNDTEIAAAITYTRNAWSNHAQENIVQPAEVLAARK